jgi:predicted transcriptional regulator YdeE
MSDTPRTDKAYRICYTMGEADAFDHAINHGQELERELNEAMERIKELEEDK